MRILVVEDDSNLAAVISRGLKKHGFATDVAADGEEGLYLAQNGEYELMILDVMLPKLDGFQVCEALRRDGAQIPILMLTARDEVNDRITGLDVGADDYLVKPFDFMELLARVRALLRRRPTLSENVLQVDDLRLDRTTRSATRRERTIELTTKEYALLEFLMERAGRVVTRDQIADYVWDRNFDTASNVIDVYIKRLRRKVDGVDDAQLIRTMRGTGYFLKTQTSEDE